MDVSELLRALWQKLREGNQIRFSPSANRTAQLEDLINKMMDPDPETRPSIDEILLHPNLSKVMYKEQTLKVEDIFNQRNVIPSNGFTHQSPRQGNSPSPNFKSIQAMSKEKGTIIISPSTVAQDQMAQKVENFSSAAKEQDRASVAPFAIASQFDASSQKENHNPQRS